jgi:peptide/nickel transport system ATP-binding protein
MMPAPAMSFQSEAPHATPADDGGRAPGAVLGLTADRAGREAPVVVVEDLHVSFARNGRTVSAVRGVSMSIGRGEIVGLVGESGSGKSVLGLSLLGLLPFQPPPTVTGSVVVCGLDMVTADPEQRRVVRRDHLGAVFQDPMTSLNPTMPVGRQVAEAAGSGQEAVRLLEAVGVPDPVRRAGAFPHELSGGLRQRAMIAMAVAGRPSFVVADEPTTALDVTVQAQILELIARLRDEYGTSFLLVTHDLGVAAEIADRIAVMYAGRIVEVGPARDVFLQPSHPYTIGLLHSRLVLGTDRERQLRALPGEPPDPRQYPSGCAFRPRCELATDVCANEVPTLVAVSTGPISSRAIVELGAPGPGPRPAATLAACYRLSDVGVLSDRQHTGELWANPGPGGWAQRAPAVVVSGLHKSFSVRSGFRRSRLQALRGVDLEVREGEAVALVGESGCGKSTLLRAIAGLQSHDSGSIELGRGARPQMVFQDAGASLTPWLTVGELVGERLREEHLGRAERSRRVDEALRLVGLPPEVGKVKPAQLSGGQRQRVALARATVVAPEVLLCDEPTSALDVSLAATVLNLIGRLRRELGMAVLFVTHDLAAARLVADRIAVMYLGRVVELGPAGQLTEAPLHPYTKALLSAVPDLDHDKSRLQGEPANPLRPPAGCSFHPRCPLAVATCTTGSPVLLTFGGHAPWSHEVACPVVAPESPVRPGIAVSLEEPILAGEPISPEDGR